MRRETEKGAATKERIIVTAADLFHKQGVSATSPDEIIEESGTGKGQFYHYFKNKEWLVHEVLLRYLHRVEGGRGPVNHNVSSWADLEQWFLDHVKFQKGFDMIRACPIGVIGNGVTEKDEMIRVDVTRIFDAIRSRLAAFSIREKALGRLVPTADETALAEFCLAVVQGAMFMGKIRRSSGVAEATMQEALARLRQYVVPNAPTAGATGGGATSPPRSMGRRARR